MNAVFVESIGIGESMYYGPGAGQNLQQQVLLQISLGLLAGSLRELFESF